MATEYSQLSQSERSRTNLETSNRRLKRRGITLQQIGDSYPASVLESVAPSGPIESEQGRPDIDQRFCIEQLNGAGYWCLSLPAQYADKARDLQANAEGLAKALPGVKFRVRKVSGNRAVLRIAARRNEAGELETFSWSS